MSLPYRSFTYLVFLTQDAEKHVGTLTVTALDSNHADRLVSIIMAEGGKAIPA